MFVFLLFLVSNQLAHSAAWVLGVGQFRRRNAVVVRAMPSHRGRVWLPRSALIRVIPPVGYASLQCSLNLNASASAFITLTLIKLWGFITARDAPIHARVRLSV